ncbi:hypothetical protein BC962_2046 [Gillisia mitskevichiae]|uniref:G domain-containing protein n=1 Tax=Gillisia mitskevichiae TaxID=270921 RepID=A0A495PVI1_9FLAO|nr:GTPase domain-containing protein [Gillisia mitskevichiae]RKS53790.1 hypothetical protein BC962_2046 [Gillisia mitskevichiae]
MNLPLFIPIIWGVALGAATILGLGIGSYAFFSKSEDPEKNKLGILGMQGAGKTRFLSYLRNIPFVDKETEIQTYSPFTYKSHGKVIQIDSGEDIGGGNLYRDEYDRIIKKSNVIFYFFDISKYLNDPIQEGISYRRASNSRIEHINSIDKFSKKNILIVGTHFDLCKNNQKEVRSEFLKLNENKSYYSILKQIELIDLTHNDQLKNFTKKVFK